MNTGPGSGPAAPSAGRGRGGPLAVVAIAAALIGIALADGGYGADARAASALAVWVLVLALVLRQRAPDLTPQLASALAALAALALWSFASLGWGSDDGTGYLDAVGVLGYTGLVAAVALLRFPPVTWLRGLALGLGAVVFIALAPPLLGLGSDASRLAAELPAAGGRISFPLGYWNALGLCAALTIPLGLWLAGGTRLERRAGYTLFPAAAAVIVLTEARSAALAAAIAAAIFILAAGDRRLALATVLAAMVSLLPLLAVLLPADALRAGGDGGIGTTQLIVIAALVAGPILGLRTEARLAARTAGLGAVRMTSRGLAVVAVLGLTAAGLALGPGGVIGDFSADRSASSGDLTQSVASGSGRAQFWSAALDAAATEPIRGIGAGNFGNWWNAEGGLDVSVENVHSLWLETLAELGLVGLGLLLIAVAALAMAARASWATAAGEERSALGATLALVGVGAIGFSLDWIWEMPASAAPVIVAAGVLLSGALAPGLRRLRTLEASATLPGYSYSVSPARLRPGLVGAALALAAVLAIGASGVKFISAQRLDASLAALAVGDVVSASESARGAAAVEPWAADPELTLAAIEQGAGNLEAARRAAARAARRDPRDFRSWFLLAQIHAALGEQDPAASYFRRAQSLAPLVLGRAFITER